MSIKREQKFLIDLESSFSFYHDTFFYKIPDTIGSRFTPPKPFDVFANYKSYSLAIEGKAMEFEGAINYNLLEDSQKEHLPKFQSLNHKRLSIICVQIKHERNLIKNIPRVNKFYYFTHDELKVKGSFHKKDLENFTQVAEFKNGKYDLKDFFSWIEKTVDQQFF